MDMKYLESRLLENGWQDIACNGNFKGEKFDLVARRKLGWGVLMFNFLVRVVPSLDLKTSMILKKQYNFCYREVHGKLFSNETFCMCIVAEEIPGDARLLMDERRLLQTDSELVVFDVEGEMWHGIKKVDEKFIFVSQAYYRDKKK